MPYKKGHHCNANCRYFFGEDVTIYNPDHGGNPGSTDYEEYQRYCCYKVDDGERIYGVKYNCPLYAENTTSTTDEPLPPVTIFHGASDSAWGNE